MYTIQRRHARLLAALATLLAASLATPSALRAQRLGRIEGQVRDSLHGQPAAGATVYAVRVTPEPNVFLSTLADREGRFHFDSLTAGRYTLSFSTGTLDSLGVMVPDREVVLAGEERQRVELALPSAATLQVAACPGLALAPATGAVIGIVSDAATERPMPSATVVVAWQEVDVDRATLRATSRQRTGAVRADSLGRYRLCGVPTGQPLLIQAQDSVWSSGAVEATVDSAVTIRQVTLSIDRTAAPLAAVRDTAAAAQRAAAAPQLASGTAAVRGVVLGIGDQPLRDVQLHVIGAAPVARSDSLGRYALSNLPAGTQLLEAKRVGYSAVRVPVELRSGRTVTQEVRMTRVVSLDSVRIVAQRSRYPDFERHRRNTGWGHFLDEADILRRYPFRTADLLRTMPGFRVLHNGFEDVVVSSRGSVSFSGRSCATNIIIDGMQHMDIDMVHPSDIAGLEAYPSAAGMPPEYASSSPCGAVIIWTKR